jgi:hypothetical protein
MRIFTLAASCAAIGFFVLSCNDDTAGTTGGAGGDSAAAIVDHFCEAHVAPYCEASVACCHDPQRAYLSVESCKDSRAERYEYPTTFCWRSDERKPMEAALRAGAIVFDQAQLDTCLARLKLLSAGGDACVHPPVNDLSFSCIAAFRGQIAPGGACTSSVRAGPENNTYQCKDGYCKNGQCAPFLKAGDVCTTRPESVDWTQNHYCNFLAGEWCHGPISPLDNPGAAGEGKGICTRWAELGEACDPSNGLECASASCDKTGKCILPDPMWRMCSGSPPY